jgi:hypothetical protein
MRTVLNGEIVSEADARRLVAHAQARGWLPVDIPNRAIDPALDDVGQP